MSYAVKEIFYTLQGEGAQAGRPAVFCRFSRCNLWSGKEKDREHAICQFCDTDFLGIDGPNGGEYETESDLVSAILDAWAPTDDTGAEPFVVCTGGEPLLQLNSSLLEALHGNGFEVAVETNGTLLAPTEIDWICVSPKAGTRLRQMSGNEIKLVYPYDGLDPGQYEKLDFDHFYLQPLDNAHFLRNIELAVQYCLNHPRWRLSLQTQKVFGDPANEPKLLSLLAYAPSEDIELMARQSSDRIDNAHASSHEPKRTERQDLNVVQSLMEGK